MIPVETTVATAEKAMIHRASRFSRTKPFMKPVLIFLLLTVTAISGSAAASASPADMISAFRMKHGERRVVPDSALDRIALEQAQAMAAKDTLDHDVLGSFSSRIAPAKSGRAAENIAYGYDSFDKTLDQWIASSSHRANLLLHDASRVGIASARSPVSHRTYWAMEIADDYAPLKPSSGRKAPAASKKKTAGNSCGTRILGLCF